MSALKREQCVIHTFKGKTPKTPLRQFQFSFIFSCSPGEEKVHYKHT